MPWGTQFIFRLSVSFYIVIKGIFNSSVVKIHLLFFSYQRYGLLHLSS